MSPAPVNFAERVIVDLGPAPDPAVEASVDHAPPKRHRRRGATLERAIHEAVFAELAEVGYAAFTIESVATRARTGKASIYRRWPTKQDLVLEAFCGKFGETMQLIEGALAENVTTREALLRVGQRMSEVATEAGEAVRAAACEISRDAELATALDERVNCPKREIILGLLRRGVERGEVRQEAACELMADVLPAMIMFKLILQNQPVDDAAVTRNVDDVVMPLLRSA